MKPRLIPEWQRVLKRAWSIRLILLAGLLTGCEALINVFGVNQLPVPSWARSIIVLGVIGGAFVTRLLAQNDDDS